MSVTDARASSDSEEESDDMVYRYAKRKYLESVCSMLDRRMNLISRELSRRLGEKQGGTRRRRVFGGV